MQYKVPQNVDVEDKVIAGLTLRQFVFLMSGGGIVLILFFAITGPIRFLFFPLAVLVTAISISLAFLKINERPFEIFLISAAKTLLSPNRRVWRKEVEIHEVITKVEHRPIYKPPRKGNIEDVRSNLEKLATIVDSGSLNGMTVNEEYLTNIKAGIIQEEPIKVHDVLMETEIKTPQLDDYLAESKKQVESRADNAPISELTTQQPDITTYKYEKIQLKSEAELESILEAANAKKHIHEAEIENAEIEKFR